MVEDREIVLTVNGEQSRGTVSPRMTLADYLRDRLGLTGVHLGCEHGVCGSCTILLDGRSARSCLMLAVQAEGHDLTTIEGLAGEGETLHPVQKAFTDHHALQCGFCTPGFVMTVIEFLVDAGPDPSEEEIRQRLAGNLCRCTGYQNIVAAVRRLLNDREHRAQVGDGVDGHV